MRTNRPVALRTTPTHFPASTERPPRSGARSRKIAVAVILFHLLGSVVCRCPVSVAQDQLEQLEQQVRKELSDSQAARRPESPQPVPDDRQPGYLGIIADDRSSAGTGVEIVHVAADGPAARAGLQVGDRITAIDGRPLGQMRDLAQLMAGSRAGDSWRVTVQRDQRSRDVPVTLRSRPPRNERLLPEFGRIPEAAGTPGVGSQAAPATLLGLRVAPLTETARRQHNLPVVAGVLVAGVAQGSPAQRAGLPPGAVIVAVGGQTVASTARFDQLIADALPAGVVPLTYYDHGTLTETQLRPDTARPPADSQRPAPLPPPQPPAPEDLLERLRRLQQRVEQLERRIDQLERSR